jgi:hypothetical protein
MRCPCLWRTPWVPQTLIELGNLLFHTFQSHLNRKCLKRLNLGLIKQHEKAGIDANLCDGSSPQIGQGNEATSFVRILHGSCYLACSPYCWQLLNVVDLCHRYQVSFLLSPPNNREPVLVLVCCHPQGSSKSRASSFSARGLCWIMVIDQLA